MKNRNSSKRVHYSTVEAVIKFLHVDLDDHIDKRTSKILKLTARRTGDEGVEVSVLLGKQSKIDKKRINEYKRRSARCKEGQKGKLIHKIQWPPLK